MKKSQFPLLKQCFLVPVYTYPDIFESATFSFRIRLPSTRIRRIRQRIRKEINPLSRVEKNISATNPITLGGGQSGKKKSATNPITCGRVNPDIFLSDDLKRVSRHNVEGEQSKFPSTIPLYGACSEDILVQRSLR